MTRFTTPFRTVMMACIVLLAFSASAQIMNPVTWSFSQEQVAENEYDLNFTAKIDDNWSIYGLNLSAGGPIPTAIEFRESDGYELLGDMRHPPVKVKFDPNFNMEIPMFTGTVTFSQRVRVNSASPLDVQGEVSFMACDDQHCIPPDYIEFTFSLPAAVAKPAATPAPEDKEKPAATATTSEPDAKPAATNDQEVTEETEEEEVVIGEPQTSEDTEVDVSVYTQEEEESKGLGRTFVLGLLGGLLGLLTPCVFPMIPLTVSFFLRNADNRARAVRDAMLYGATIVFSYVVLGLAISMIFGAGTLNALATSPVFNIFFFALLVFFAASFLGAFELTMPASWSTALDSKADKTGGIIGALLMGLTFVLVSFSCTGPIVGTLLVEAAVGGGGFAPAVGMLGFSLALAIPFSLFALFPAALKSLPKSGGWMSSIKAVLGFVVLAFSLKFLSIADAVGQWGILDREVFLVLWIAIFMLMGLYLIGKIKFAHDSDLPYLSVPRLIVAIFTFAFVFYLIPGLWGAPLKAVSSFLPSPVTQDFDLSRMNAAQPAASTANETIYIGESVKEGPYGLMFFTDYEEGMAAAKKAGMPVFLDFTGYGCANCRKMEGAVWPDPEVLQRLRNDFVRISLYVDDRTRLPESEQFVSDVLGRERKVVTVGQKWSVFQAERYGANTQPYYVILDHEENMLAPAYGYDASIPKFTEFLDTGKNNF